jgi:hypothetical protein
MKIGDWRDPNRTRATLPCSGIACDMAISRHLTVPNALRDNFRVADQSTAITRSALSIAPTTT